MQENTAMTSERAPSGPTPAGCLSAGTGKLLPPANMVTPSGKAFSLGQFHGRRNLVVVLPGAGAASESVERLLTQLARGRAALDEEKAEVLVVLPGDADGPRDEASRALTVLVDEDARFYRSMGAVDAAGRAAPALYITDLYREIYCAVRPGDEQWPSSIDEVLSWLVFMNIQCPECSVPEW